MGFDALGKGQSLRVDKPVTLEFDGCFAMAYSIINISGIGVIQTF